MHEVAAVVLAGGAGRRMGGVTKPIQQVGGVPLLVRVLHAVSSARPRIVVGPPELAAVLPHGVRLTRERPAGGGPVAATAAGLDALIYRGPQPPPARGQDMPAFDWLDTPGNSGVAPPTAPRFVALLAADLPFLTPEVIGALRAAAARPDTDGAVLVDMDGRRQWLCGVWTVAALVARLRTLGDPAGQGVRNMVAGLRVTPVEWPPDSRPGRISGTGMRGGAAPAPWFDCDTEEDLKRAKEWIDGGAGGVDPTGLRGTGPGPSRD